MENIYQIGDIIRVSVYDTKPYAAFVNTKDGQKGLLHISEISDNFIRDIERYVAIGDEINVIILEIDEKDGFLRVSYKKVPNEESFTTHRNDRKLPETTAEDFKPLEDNLERWINEAKEKMKENKND